MAVFENRFPSLAANSPAAAQSPWSCGPAHGQCDVVVFSKDEVGSLGSLSEARRVLLIEALIDRYRQLHEAGFAYVMPFENRGSQVGVTLPHPHGQIYAFANVPEPQAAAARAFESGYNLIAAHASWDGVFDVAADGDLVAFCPPFARFPFETWIMPKVPCSGPWALSASAVHSLARLLAEVPRKLDALFGEAMPYMMSFQAAPSPGRRRPAAEGAMTDSSPHMTNRARVPGRVNLIGEWIDFNGGTVLPMALAQSVELELSANGLNVDRVRSAQFPDRTDFDIDAPAAGHWSDYVRGGLQFARARGWSTGGQDVTLASSIPVGAGLSSSAATIVATLKAASLHLPDIDPVFIAHAAKSIER